MARTLSDGHISPLDFEMREGNIVDEVGNIRRELVAVRRNADPSVPANAVEFPDIRASNLYENRGAFVDMLGVDAVQLVSGDAETVKAGMQCIAGTADAYFEVSAPDDDASSGGTAWGWRSTEARNIDLATRYWANSAGTLAITYILAGAGSTVYASGGDSWGTVLPLIGMNPAIAQSWTESNTGNLLEVEAYLAATAGATGDVSAYLCNTIGGTLFTSIGTIGTYPASGIGTAGQWVKFSATSPSNLPVTAGSVYAIFIDHGWGPEGTVTWYTDSAGATYGGGAAQFYNASDPVTGNWEIVTGADRYLKVKTGGAGTATVATATGFDGWREAVVNLNARMTHDFYSSDNAADFYVTIPDGWALNALKLRDTATNSEVHWRAGHVRTRHISGPVFLQAALTSTSWDNDAKATTDAGTIDLSAVFGVPPRVKAVLVELAVTDAAAVVSLGPNASTPQLRVFGNTAAGYIYNSGWVACDSNGDIYFNTSADASNVSIRIHGYWP